ncbi:MAG: pilus assembly protein TadG-related protein [Acidimicrobiales bacterium]
MADTPIRWGRYVQNEATLTGDEAQAGYVLATTALLLIPLMIFAALAVDVGGWYAQATQAQRAADAAALAAARPHAE